MPGRPKKTEDDTITTTNSETEKLLLAMKNMKREIIADRLAVDNEIIAKIDAIDTKLTDNLAQHSTRLVALETEITVHSDNIGNVQNDVARIKKDVIDLKDKLLYSVAHSRRLNLDFLGFKDELKEEPIAKVKAFLVNTLKLESDLVNSILICDGHRIGKFNPDISAKPRVIKIGFVRMEDRNLILGLAYKCKATNYAVRVDLPPELADVRKVNLDIRKSILEANPNALASCSYRSYKPVLLVKYQNKVQEFKTSMKFDELQDRDPQGRS